MFQVMVLVIVIWSFQKELLIRYLHLSIINDRYVLLNWLKEFVLNYIGLAFPS